MKLINRQLSKPNIIGVEMGYISKASQSVMALLCLFALSPAVQAQQGTVFILRLDNDLVSSFESYGSLRSNVPDIHKSKISFVELRFEGSESDPVDVALPIQINGDSAQIALNNQLISRVKQQPIRVPVRKESNNFSQIVLLYDAPSTSEPVQMNDGGNGEDMYFIRLANNKTMSGKIDGFEQFEITTRFGKVSMPMDQVAGIKFHTDVRDSCVVVMTNGDLITGVPAIKAVELQTDWGQADIEPKYIEALTTSPNATFAQDSTDFGLRWNLRTGNAVAPGSPRFSN